MKNLSVLKFIPVLLLMACVPSLDSQSEDVSNVEVIGEAVEIALTDKLDGVTNNFCIDIAGGNKDVDTSKGLQAHTCYSYQGELGTDQIFDTGKFSDNVLYMPVYDVCATLSGLESGAKIGLSACDGSDLQMVSFTGEGLIKSVLAPDMCFTAAQETRFGRAKIHQIKDLSLEPCSEELAAFQTWHSRKSQD